MKDSETSSEQMEKETWIENIMNSTNGITSVSPDADLFSKIQQKIKSQDTVSSKTIWLVAASVAALILLNISIINIKSEPKENSADYLETTVNKTNQLY